MAAIHQDLTTIIGRTPLLQLDTDTGARVLAKLECMNPAGSVKDRAALYMLLDAKEKGLLNKDSVIIEPTSGNTGIGLCAIAAAWGLKCIIVMPDTMSVERQLLMKAYGADVVLSPGAKGMAGAIALAQQMAKDTPNSFIPDQFCNAANAHAHEATTGPEIWQDTDGQVDIFLAGIGTGGTVTGTGRYLKAKSPAIQILGVEPEGSPVLSGGEAGRHGIQGIGAGFVPQVLDRSILDGIITVRDEDAFARAREFSHKYGILVGISSGAALHAALETAKKPENRGKTLVVLLPDSGSRYLSSGLFD